MAQDYFIVCLAGGIILLLPLLFVYLLPCPLPPLQCCFQTVTVRLAVSVSHCYLLEILRSHYRLSTGSTRGCGGTTWHQRAIQKCLTPEMGLLPLVSPCATCQAWKFCVFIIFPIALIKYLISETLEKKC